MKVYLVEHDGQFAIGAVGIFATEAEAQAAAAKRGVYGPQCCRIREMTIGEIRK